MIASGHPRLGRTLALVLIRPVVSGTGKVQPGIGGLTDDANTMTTGPLMRATPPRSRWRWVVQGVAFAAIAVLALYASFAQLARNKPWAHLRDDGTDGYLAALSVVRDAIPDRQRIGYLTEAPVDCTRAGPIEATYYMAQYALVPIVVDPQPIGDLMLVNLVSPRVMRKLLAGPDVRLVRQFAADRALVTPVR